MSPNHLNRYIDGLDGRHNSRPMDTTGQMAALVQGSEGKRLT